MSAEKNIYAFDQAGELIYQELKLFVDTVNDFLNDQPSASELDATDNWLRQLNAIYAQWAQMQGKAESFHSALTYHVIDTLDPEEFKKIKNSSTITERYVKGKWPKAAAICSEVDRLGHVLRSAADNTRTLVSSYRLEREYVLKMQVRQTVSN